MFQPWQAVELDSFGHLVLPLKSRIIGVKKSLSATKERC